MILAPHPVIETLNEVVGLQVREEWKLRIPILSNMVSDLRVLFKTKRYVAYTTIFVATTFLALFVSWLITLFVGTSVERVLVGFFVYVGATGAIYFGLGTLFTGLRLDRLWITRRGRGPVNELKGAAWLAISFAVAVFLSIGVGESALLFFAIFGWVGWIAFQAYLSSRTSLRLATIAEPKKGSVAITVLSFVILIVGIGVIGAEILAALVLIPNDVLGLGTAVSAVFPNAVGNILMHWNALVVAMGLLALFVLVSLISYLRYAGRGAALNISLLVLFVGVYSGYFLFNVIRRTGAPVIEVQDVLMTLFFLAYGLAGVGHTMTEVVEETRARLRDFGPLVTFFLASGYIYVSTIIAVTATAPNSLLGGWYMLNWSAATSYTVFLFQDIAKLIAFPLAAIITSVYYLTVERTRRVLEHAREAGEAITPETFDEEIAEAAPGPGEAWPTERTTGIPGGRPGHRLSSPDRKRLVVDESRRFKGGKRLGHENEEQEEE